MCNLLKVVVMNKLLYTLSVLLVLLLAGCNKEDDVHAELGDSWYDLKDDPSDPVQHYIHELYANTGVVLVVDPDIRDYRFNFTKKNNIRVVAPKQASDLLTQGIEFARKIFLDIYPDDFKKAYFPYNIILADSILFWEWRTRPRVIMPLPARISWLLPESVPGWRITRRRKSAR